MLSRDGGSLSLGNARLVSDSNIKTGIPYPTDLVRGKGKFCGLENLGTFPIELFNGLNTYITTIETRIKPFPKRNSNETV